MIIQCSSCRTRYHYDEARFAGAPAKKIRCTKCGTVFEIRNPAFPAPVPSGFQPDETGPLNSPILGSDDFSLDATVMGGGPRKRPVPTVPPPVPAAAFRPPAPVPPPVPVPPPLPSPPRHPTAEYPRAQFTGETEGAGRRLKLPDQERLSLACLAGPDAGKIFEIEKARVVLGRAGADVLLSDGECSRQHAAIEVQEDKVYLIDLGSTNGTYIGERRVTRTELENRTEFDVGASTLMFIRTRRD